MHLKDFARRLPDEVWAEFEPVLPPVVQAGTGRPPAGNREVLHALLYVLASGVAWEMLPWCFPSYKTVQRRLRVWSRSDAFRTVWRRLAERYAAGHGVNWDQVLLDGSKKPAKKGGPRPARVRWTAASAGRPSTSRRTRGGCPSGRS